LKFHCFKIVCVLLNGGFKMCKNMVGICCV